MKIKILRRVRAESHPTHWLISTQVAGPDHFVDQVVSHLTLTKGYPADCVVYF